MPRVGDFGQNRPVAAGDVQALVGRDFAPIVVIYLRRDAAILVGQVHHAAQTVGVDVIGVDALLYALCPPVGALAGGVHVHQA